MSYRIYVNDIQCLGNNECPEVLINELEKQGCKFDEDGCFDNFEIKDLQGVIEALEKYIYEKEEITKKIFGTSIADYSNDFENWKSNFTYRVSNAIDCGYLFITYNFLQYIKGKYEEDYDFDKNRMVYKIKDNHQVYMSGF